MTVCKLRYLPQFLMFLAVSVELCNLLLGVVEDL